MSSENQPTPKNEGNVLSRLLRSLTRLLADIFYIFRISPLTLLSLLVLFLFIWVSDQGQDLLLVINDSFFGPVLLFAIISVLALMNWHFPKFFFEKEWREQRLKVLFRGAFTISPEDRESSESKLAIARQLGVLTFFIPAFGILKMLEMFQIPYRLDFFSPMGWLLISMIVLQVLFEFKVFQWLYRRLPVLCRFVCYVLAVLPLVFALLNNGEPADIIWLFWGLLGYGVLFAIVTTNRMEMSVRLKWLNDQNLNRIVWYATLFPILLFVLYIVFGLCYFPGFPVRFLTMAVVLSGIIAYYALLTALTVWGRIIRINVPLIFILLFTVVANTSSNQFHYVDERKSAVKPMPFSQYLKSWLAARRKQLTTKDSVYTIYLVNTYGGGIRASVWTCITINKLDSMQKARNGELFQDHIFAYSGASGGTIGASVLCANNAAQNVCLPTSTYLKFFGNDYLTSVVTGIIGNDLWLAPAGSNIPDRSKVQEHLWEHFFHVYFNSDNLGHTEEEIWPGQYRVPLLFSNTTDVAFGRKGIFAPVALDSAAFPGSTIVRECLEPGYTLKLSSGAFLSARFPFLSPSAGFNADHWFLDGGMVDNSGAGTAWDIYRLLKQEIQSNDSDKNHFRVTVISINNNYLLEDSSAQKKEKGIPQLTAPLTAMLNVGVEGNSKKADGINAAYFNRLSGDPMVDTYFLVRPTVERLAVPVHSLIPGRNGQVDQAVIPLPLGWSISDLALQRMEVSADSLSAKGGLLYNIINR